MSVQTKPEIAIYQQVEPKIRVKDVAKLLDFEPHNKQKELFEAYDTKKLTGLVAVFGRRTGKSSSISVIITAELLIPNAKVILLAPTYNNTKAIFTDVIKHLRKLKLNFTSMNNNEVKFELENGSTFIACTQLNIKSVLGQACSLLVIEESQSIDNLTQLVEVYLAPTMLDYGVRPENETLTFAKTLCIGTPRGKGNQLYDFFCKELVDSRWKSFRAKTADNPTIPFTYLESIRATTDVLTYKQEYEAEFLDASGLNVFFGFNPDVNIIPYENVVQWINNSSTMIAGIDIGFSDSTALVLTYVAPNGDYYIIDSYCEKMRTTEEHVTYFKQIENQYQATVEIRYIDPAAAQTKNDFAATYDYYCTSGKNAVTQGLDTLNSLFQPSVSGRPPRLFICDNNTELLRQIQMVSWNDSRTDFKKDTLKGTHYDLIAALRYCIYSFELATQSGNILQTV